VIVICPGYSFSSIPSGGKSENVMFLDSFGWRMKLFWETTRYSEIVPEDSIFVIVGDSKVFVIMISLETL